MVPVQYCHDQISAAIQNSKYLTFSSNAIFHVLNFQQPYNFPRALAEMQHNTLQIFSIKCNNPRAKLSAALQTAHFDFLGNN
jgi:hypothetical protein